MPAFVKGEHFGTGPPHRSNAQTPKICQHDVWLYYWGTGCILFCHQRHCYQAGTDGGGGCRHNPDLAHDYCRAHFCVGGVAGISRQKFKNTHFRVPPGAALKAAGVGAIGYYLASYLDFAGLEFITAQLDRLILMTSPIFVVLISAIINKRAIGLKTIGALIMSYLGLAVIFWQDLALDGANVITGALLVLGAAIAYAIYQILAKPLIDQMGARLFTSIAMSAAGILIMIQFAFTHQLSDLLVSEFAFILMLAMGTVSTVLPAYMIATSIGIIGPGPTAVIGNISPIVTIFLAITILEEIFSLYHALGAAMVLLGIFAFTRFENPD